ncbi:polysaccharide biosynthesis tyrosine autokinase [bacterium]|nr:polysaccharide biosynthesis tyrosine autokinase [bacterium]
MPNPTNDRAPSANAPLSDPWHYVRIVWQRFYLVVLLVAVALMIGVLQLRRTPPSYTATAVLKYEPRSQQLVDLGERSSLLYQRDEIATAVQLVRSPAVAELVIQSLGQETAPASSSPAPERGIIDRMHSFWIDTTRSIRARIVATPTKVIDDEIIRHEERVKGYLNGLQVVHRPNTKLIEVRYTAGDPVRAARLSNAFCEQYIRSLDSDRRALVSSARTFVDQQIKEAKERLDRAERSVYDFSGQADMRVLDKNLEIMTQTMSDLNNQVQQLGIEIVNLEAESEATSKEDVRSVLLERDDFYNQLRQRQTELAIQKGNLAAENERDFPALVKLEREIKSLDEQLRQMEEKAASQVQARLELSRLKRDKLSAMLDEQKKAIGDLQERMITYRILTREVESSQTIFTTLLDSYQRLEVVGEGAQSNVAIVSRASIPRVPSAPSVNRTLLGWLALGIASGLGLALLLDFADRTIRTPSIVEERLGLPTLGLVPSMARGIVGRSTRRSTRLDAKSTEVQREALQYVRTSILYSIASKPPKVVLITSCLPQEGKSTIAANLAITTAQAGVGKVLLIDVDLKRPTSHRYFEQNRHPGLTDLLTRQVTREEAIKATGVDNLDILPAGNAVPAPINLLDSAEMRELIADLRNHYAMIILDSAPSHAMADSLVVSKVADGVCLVVRQGRTAIDLLGLVASKYTSLGAMILGVIYNQPRTRRASGYGGGYGAGYGFQYQPRPVSRDSVPRPD